MNIKKIDNNTMQFTLDDWELNFYNLEIDDIKNSMKDKECGKIVGEKLMDIIHDVNKEYEKIYGEFFIKDNALLSIGATVTKDNQLNITVHKSLDTFDKMKKLEEMPFDEIEDIIENDEELPPIPKALENLFKSMLGLPVDWDEYDKNYEMTETTNNNELKSGYQAGTPHISKISNKINKNTIEDIAKSKLQHILFFKKLDDVINFAKIINKKDTKNSNLYKTNENLYVLHIETSENDISKKNIEYLLSEFYINKYEPPKIPCINFVKEHYDILIETNAIEKLQRI